MIDWVQAFWLALLQGLTEFLPISSSAHLIIPSLIWQWPDQGLAFDVAVHVGTLAAVVVYYRRDLSLLLGGCTTAIVERKSNEHSRLLACLAFASVPVGLMGLLAVEFVEQYLRNLPMIAAATLLFGLLMAYADRHTKGRSTFKDITLSLAIIIGLFQALAPWPGVSRSGITITAALLLGLSRPDAARFSFLLSIPVISGAGLLKTTELVKSGVAVDWLLLGAAAFTASVVAFASIALFLRLLDRVGLMPFVYYRIALALVLFGLWLA
ncbi:MAG: undecaprenyl-diphosphate phosphatase [Halioglobus sp.]